MHKHIHIAYLILAHDNSETLRTLIKLLNSPQATFFVHLDKKTEFDYRVLPRLKNVHTITDRVRINWGGYSSIEATLKLLKAAAKSGCDRYVLLSGTSLPVRSATFIQNYFATYPTTEFINSVAMPGNGKNLDRLESYYWEFDPRQCNLQQPQNLIKKYLNSFVRLSPFKRPAYLQSRNMRPYGGSTWWALSDSAVNYILTFSKQNPDFLQFFKHTLCPDEMFFQTILGNSPFIQQYQPSFMYADWSTGVAPLLITPAHFPRLAKKIVSDFGTYEPLFARKFDDQHQTVIKALIHRFKL